MRLLTDGSTKTMVLQAAASGLADAWSAALFDRNSEYELCILLCLFCWIALHHWCKSRATSQPLASRPTVVANTIHSLCTAAAATALLMQPPSTRAYWWWQRWMLPFSISYFMGDLAWYCWPRKDLLVALHHAVCILCNFPVGEPLAASLCGAGNATWAVNISMAIYCSEWSNIFLNIRWWLSMTLQHDHPVWALTNACVVATFVGRCTMLPYLIGWHILPRWRDFLEHEQLLAFGLCFLGCAVICLLSAHWLSLLCGRGLQPLLHFQSQQGQAGDQRGDLIMDRKRH